MSAVQAGAGGRADQCRPCPHHLAVAACPADREDLRLAQREFVGLPLPLLAQLLAATALCLAGGLRASGEFRPVALADNPR